MKLKMALLFLLPIFLTGCTLKKDWTLMLCSELMDDGVQCYENSSVIEGFETMGSCMSTGASYVSSGKAKGFECGKNCELIPEGHDIRVCDTICNEAGCSE